MAEPTRPGRNVDVTNTEHGLGDTGAPSEVGYLCVYSRSDPAIPNVPLLRATNVLGTLMLESGLMPVFASVADAMGSAGEALMTVMPIEMIGVEVHEELHRFDIVGQLPDPTHGVRATNQVGEHIAAVTMRWMIAPEDFVPVLDKVPPPTALDMTKSQKFVMIGGRMTFRDGAQSGLRGFGSGRTFPAVIRGKPQLRIAAIVDVIEGFGHLKNLPGTIVVNGYVQPPKGLFINFVARFIDPAGQLRTGDTLDSIQAIPEPDPSTTFLAFVGEPHGSEEVAPEVGSDPARIGTRMVERLRLIHTEFDLGSTEASGLRTNVSEGPPVGTMAATLWSNAAESKPPRPYTSTDGVFTFVDASGRTVGTLRVDIVEGKVFEDEVEGRPVMRRAGFGPLLGGTGVFEGAIGMLTVNAGVGVSSLYIIRISDPDGRYRSAYERAVDSVPGVAGTNGGRRSSGAAVLTDEDHLVINTVEPTIARGIAVRAWLEERERGGGPAERFEVIRQFNEHVRSFGFFDAVSEGSSRQPVMGLVQEMVYDRAAPGPRTRDEFREFLLRYFMRVSHGLKPTVAAEDGHVPPPYLRPLSWLPDEDNAKVGFGYRQLYYKLRESGQIGKFPKDQQCAMVDLREIGDKYDWIVAHVSIFDFNIAMSPLGGSSMRFLYPMKEEAFIALSPAFITCDERTQDDVAGRFGFGYVFLPYTDRRGMIAYGPGYFSLGLQTFDFAVKTSGEIGVRAAFVVNRPEQIMKVNVDPVEWSFKVADMMTMNLASRVLAPVKGIADRLPLRIPDVDPISAYITAANVATAGLAGRQLGISKEQLEKRMLVQHFMQHYDMLLHSLQVWRTFNTWSDPTSLPEYCHRGMEL